MTAPDRWLAVRARPVVVEEDDGSLAEALLALGGRAVQQDREWWCTHLPAETVDDDDPDLWRRRVAARRPSGAVEVEVQVAWQAHGDWSELWKRGLEPRRVTPRLLVCPSWCRAEPEEGVSVLTLDPGVAFGSAEHGTTRGCLRLLDAAVTGGSRIVDVGSGSGILAIAAALLGAERVTAFEGDPLAVPAARHNARRNGVADRVEVVEAWVGPDDLAALGPVDGLVANIEFGVLASLLPAFRTAVGAGAWLILSGVLVSQWSDLVALAEAMDFELDAHDVDGEWVSGRFIRGRSPTPPSEPPRRPDGATGSDPPPSGRRGPPAGR